MTFKKKRAFHFSGASWLLLCAMADGALQISPALVSTRADFDLLVGAVDEALRDVAVRAAV